VAPLEGRSAPAQGDRYCGAMTKSPAAKPARKRPTRKQLDERLSIPLGPKDEEAEAQADAEALAASRQRVRDRAGDEPPPKGTGRPRK